MPCDSSLARVLGTVRPVGIRAVSLDHWQPSSNYVYRLPYISIPAVWPMQYVCAFHVILMFNICFASKSR
jgi:hypothetical protein